MTLHKFCISCFFKDGNDLANFLRKSKEFYAWSNTSICLSKRFANFFNYVRNTSHTYHALFIMYAVIVLHLAFLGRNGSFKIFLWVPSI